MTRCLIAATGFALLTAATYQDVALKDLMPKGMVIGVAINQRQFDGVDTAAVEIITKQFNQISPENVLKFQPTHPAADRYTFDARGSLRPVRRRSPHAGGRPQSRVAFADAAPGCFRAPTASPPIATRCSRACAITSAPSSAATKARSTAGTSSTKRSTKTGRCASRRGRTASATTTSPRPSSSRTRPIRTPSCITTTSISRSPRSAPA